MPFARQGTGSINMLVFALLTIIADLKGKKSVIFAMEEPEIALPPHTQRRVTRFVLREMGQSIVTSHSPYVIEQFKPGDVVTSIDGQTIETFVDMQRIVSTRAGEQLHFTVKRGDRVENLTATPELREVKDSFNNVHKIGILGISRSATPGEHAVERVDPATGLWLGVKETWFVAKSTILYIGDIFTRRASADQLGGPIRIAQISGQVATIGLAALVHLTAVLSVSIGLLNLFPVPMLDGGHLLFYAVEAIRGRPLSERSQEMGFRLGLALVLMLMVFATYNDILHLAGS
ncbi:MAG: site-2 protease family protein [Afipia sp.]|nr:site-2 protease family protein [Afipia sp.]